MAAPKPLDGDRSATVAVGAQFWINGMVHAAIVPRLPDIRDRVDVGVAGLGAVLTMAALGGLLGSALSERAIARFGTRRCIQAGTVVTVLVLPAVGIVRSPVLLVLVLAVVAMVDVVIDIAMNLQGSWLSARRATPVMNRLHGLWSLGTVVGGIIAVRVTGAGISLGSHLLAISVVLAATLAVSGRYLLRTDDRPLPAGAASAGQTTGADPSPGEVARQPEPPEAPGLFNVRLVLLILGAAAITMELTTSDWASFRLADDLGVDGGRVGLGFVAFTSGMVTGRFAGDAIQGRIGERLLVRGATILAAIGLVLATLLPFDRLIDSESGATWLVIGGFYVAALGVSVIFPQMYDAAAKAPGRPGAGLAALTAGIRIAGVLAPIVVGLVAGTSLSVGAAIALVTIPSCLVVLLLPFRQTSPAGDPRQLPSEHGA